MAKLYLIAIIIASILVSLISAADIDENSTMSNGSFPSGSSFDKVGKLTMLGSMAMVAGTKLTQFKATLDLSVFFYALAFILWIIGLVLTRKKDKPKLKINNWAVVDILLKLNVFIVNILFIMNNAKNAGDDIYKLSLIIVILSGAWNVCISLLAIISQSFYVCGVKMARFCCYICWWLCFRGRENSNEHNAEEFSRWLEEYKFIATILVVCSTISLEFLEFSTSRWGGMKVFDSQMNRFGKFIVFYGAIVNIFIQDIPRFVIQIMYHKRLGIRISLMLIVNGINIFVAIISRIIYCIILISNGSSQRAIKA